MRNICGLACCTVTASSTFCFERLRTAATQIDRHPLLKSRLKLPMKGLSRRVSPVVTEGQSEDSDSGRAAGLLWTTFELSSWMIPR